jgi:hypothetical protein
MKYLKLFESFHGEDPKWIITSAMDPIEVDEVVIDDKYKDTSMFQIFKLSEEPSETDINHLKSWLEEEGYYSTIKYNNIIVTEKPLKETCVDWLNTNYSGLIKVNSKKLKGGVIYKNDLGSSILYHDKERNKVYVTDKIWNFFEETLCITKSGSISSKYTEMILIIDNWIRESYSLNAMRITYYDGDCWQRFGDE